MEYYSNNLTVLKEKNIHLYHCMLEVENELKDKEEEQFCIGEARDRSNILGLKRGERMFWLDSQYSPAHEAEMWAKGFAWKGYENIVLMFGFSNGTYIRELVNEDNVNKILIYEPSKELLYYVLCHFDVKDILESEKVMIAVEREIFQHYLETILTMGNIRTVQRGVLPFYQELFFESYKKYLKVIAVVNNDIVVGFNTMQHFWNTWIDNYCYNIRFLKKSTSLEKALSVFDKGNPVIIVSAGPSVSDELEGLKAAKNHILIVAVDRIVDFLMENGVEPDVIFTIDAKYRKSLMNVERVAHIPLVIGATASREITENHHGKKLWFSDCKFLGNIYEKLGKEVGNYELGTTVSSMAFAAFLSHGYKEIILVGQDLSYDGEFSHAGGIKEEVAYLKKEYNIAGIHGTIVRTRDDWYTMLRWYNGILARYQNVKVYDAKSRGAQINHTINIRLKEFVEQYQWQTIDYRKKLVELEPTFNSEEWKTVLTELHNGVENLKTGKEKTLNAIKCCERLIKGLEEHLELSKEDEKDLQEVQETNDFIQNQAVFALLSSYIDNYFREAMYALNEKEGNIQLDAKKVYMATIIQMQAVQYGADYLYPKLGQAIKQIEEES